MYANANAVNPVRSLSLQRAREKERKLASMALPPPNDPDDPFNMSAPRAVPLHPDGEGRFDPARSPARTMRHTRMGRTCRRAGEIKKTHPPVTFCRPFPWLRG